MQNFTPETALLGGALIGLASAILLLINGRIAGISGIAASALAFSSGSKIWKWTFLAGLVIGCYIAVYFGSTAPQPPTSNTLILIVAGSFVGIGTVVGSGCTSGHGVCGIGRLSKRSIVATLIFMLSAILTVLVWR